MSREEGSFSEGTSALRRRLRGESKCVISFRSGEIKRSSGALGLRLWGFPKCSKTNLDLIVIILFTTLLSSSSFFVLVSIKADGN